MKTDPFAQPNPDGCNFVFCNGSVRIQRFVRAFDPDPYPSIANQTGQVELGQCCDHPRLEIVYEFAHVMAAFGDVEHHVNHTLPRPMISVLPASFGIKHRETVRIRQILNVGRCPGRIEWWMFHQPNTLRRGSRCDLCHTVFHKGFGIPVFGQPVTDAPFDHVRTGSNPASLSFDIFARLTGIRAPVVIARKTRAPSRSTASTCSNPAQCDLCT